MFKVFFLSFVIIFIFSGFASKKNIKSVVQKEKKKEKNDSTKHSLIKKIQSKYKSYDTKVLKKALDFYFRNLDHLQKENLCLNSDNKNNKEKIRNLNCLVVADYSKSKLEKRLLILNPQTGESELFYTAHGKGSNASGKRETGLNAVRFSNVSGSNMTSLGFYLTDHLYNSQKNTFGPGPKNGLKLDGLNCSNNQARKRYIVMHTAQYVPPKNSPKPPKIGNSEGCITLPKGRKDILKKCEKGALVYAHGKNGKN